MAGGISFDRVASLYDATRSLPKGVEAGVADRLARLLRDERTLEIGVGTARWAQPLEARGVDLVGVDLSPAMLRIARGKGFQRAMRADVVRLPFRAGTFDGVLSNHVLHLVYDVPAALTELGRVMTGRLRSVLEFETSRPDLSAEYLERVRRSRPQAGPPGLSERALAQELTPNTVQDAVTFHARGPASVVLDALEARAFRDTWATPEELHQEVLRELRERHGEGEVLTETRVEIAEWGRDRLLAFASRRPGPADRTAVGG